MQPDWVSDPSPRLWHQNPSCFHKTPGLEREGGHRKPGVDSWLSAPVSLAPAQVPPILPHPSLQEVGEGRGSQRGCPSTSRVTPLLSYDPQRQNSGHQTMLPVHLAPLEPFHQVL